MPTWRQLLYVYLINFVLPKLIWESPIMGHIAVNILCRFGHMSIPHFKLMHCTVHYETISQGYEVLLAQGFSYIWLQPTLHLFSSCRDVTMVFTTLGLLMCCYFNYKQCYVFSFEKNLVTYEQLNHFTRLNTYYRLILKSRSNWANRNATIFYLYLSFEKLWCFQVLNSLKYVYKIL